MKIVINKCYGGFGLSDEAITRYAELKGLVLTTKPSDSVIQDRKEFDYYRGEEYFSCHEIARNDPCLVQVVEELDDKANDWAAELHVVEVPDDVEWEIVEYDGNEWIAEKHRTWS